SLRCQSPTSRALLAARSEALVKSDEMRRLERNEVWAMVAAPSGAAVGGLLQLLGGRRSLPACSRLLVLVVSLANRRSSLALPRVSCSMVRTTAMTSVMRSSPLG